MNKPNMTEGVLKRRIHVTRRPGYCNESFAINIPKTFRERVGDTERLFLYSGFDLYMSNNIAEFDVIPESLVNTFIDKTSDIRAIRALKHPLKIFGAGCRELRYPDDGMFTIIDLKYNKFNWNITTGNILELRGFTL